MPPGMETYITVLNTKKTRQVVTTETKIMMPYLRIPRNANIMNINIGVERIKPKKGRNKTYVAAIDNVPMVKNAFSFSDS